MGLGQRSLLSLLPTDRSLFPLCFLIGQNDELENIQKLQHPKISAFQNLVEITC